MLGRDKQRQLDSRSNHIGRKARRFILEKLEGTDLEKENWSELKELLRLLHPAEYKKLFPKVYNYWSEKKKEHNLDAYNRALKVLESGDIEGFVQGFMGFFKSAIKEGNGKESDILTLLCSEKLGASDLLSILMKLEKYDLGLPRKYKRGTFVIDQERIYSLIPTIKEILFFNIGKRFRGNEFVGKCVWLDPKLKELRFGETKPKEYIELGKISENDRHLKLSLKWRSLCEGGYFFGIYLWGGPGKSIKYVDLMKGIVYGRDFITDNSVSIKINDLRKRGFRYLIFDSRVNKPCGQSFGFLMSSEHKKMNMVVNAPEGIRNNFGGILDLETGVVRVINSDLSKLPIINGNIQEALIKYLLPEYNILSAYDYLELYVSSRGAEITESKNSDLRMGIKEYIKLLKK